MKSTMFILSMMLTITALVVSCSNKAGLEPTSVESLALSKSDPNSLDANFVAPFGHGSMLFKLLDLTEEQSAKIQEILKSHRKQHQRTRDSFKNRPSFEEMKAKRQEMRESIHNEILAVLTTEQQEKLNAFKTQLENGTVPEELIDLRIEQLGSKLNLTDDQKKQLKEWGFGQMLPFKFGEQENRRQAMQQRKEQRQRHEQQLLRILTPEQQALYEELKAEKQQKMQDQHRRFHGRRGQFQNRGFNRAEMLAKALDLSASQQEQLKEIFDGLREEFQMASQENRAQRNREEMRQAIRAKMQEIEAQIQSILTPEQLEKYTDLKAQRSQRPFKRFHRQ